MKTWTAYTSETQKVKLGDPISALIVERLGACLVEFFEDSSRRRRTTLVADALSLLGDEEHDNKPHYKVYSHGLSEHLRQSSRGKFKNVEWLHDLHWYTESQAKPYQITAFPLVVEYEWYPRRKGDEKDPHGGIKYDFQKLLVANADLRLMIFTGTMRKDDIPELNIYFDEAIEGYANLAEESKFLFIAFDRTITGFHFAEKFKGPKQRKC